MNLLRVDRYERVISHSRFLQREVTFRISSQRLTIVTETGVVFFDLSNSMS
jgi:hypothetical protein